MTLYQAEMLQQEWIFQHPIMQLMDFIARVLPGSKGGIIPSRLRDKKSAPQDLRPEFEQALIKKGWTPPLK